MDGVKYTGMLSAAELKRVLPAADRLARGPVAVIECVQEIPCNPCEKACPFGAITVGGDITALPVLDQEKCKGCGVCVSRCPGLAIFVVNAAYSADEALITMPYEYLPLPDEGELVRGLDRSGRPVCQGRVVKVDRSPRNDGTTVITLAVPKAYVHDVRNLRRMEKDEVLVCRCNEVTEQEVRQAVRDGARTVAAVKLRTRTGMGLCQGRTCRRLVSRIIAEETGQTVADILPATTRPPVRTLPLGALTGGEADD
ncbi:(2Fe-2S)-binding protein [Sporolituus thermophilus]|uniref:4Fe-4S binding domain-containing protein n=1 Tax=Sporolituus thermophilus DSM 23256 TaxID=1123285 RepID=A0A1G7L6B0_9FIRM|nr:(2Fe-2S)-binding protein [Sporolituus thermophilus]SDF44993.1 4Fe-4S binding domain-containing protein [Sporolituus thermophilus DSM 23256]